MKRNTLSRIGSALALVTLFGAASASADTNNQFTIAVIPDTQNYCDTAKPQPASSLIYQRQMQYLADQKAAQNIVFVTHVGDVVQHGDLYDAEWTYATSAMNILSASGLPFGMVPGNHDYDNYSHATNSRPLQGSVKWNANFGPGSAYFAGKSWFGGFTNGGLSSFQTFSAGGKTFLHISLEQEASDDTLAWATGVIVSHPGMPTILTTHEYIGPDNDASGKAIRLDDGYMAGLPYNNVQGVWDKFISQHDQIFMVLCGHAWTSTVNGVSDGENLRIDNNAFGHPVYQVLSDYQGNTFDTNGVAGVFTGGSGWLRLMVFDTVTGTIHFRTYSTELKQFAGVAGGPTFNLPLSMSDFTLILPDRVLASGYVAGDFHQHSTYTDGSNPFATVMNKNNQFGLDWWANSEHGGQFNRNAAGPILTTNFDTAEYAQFWDTTSVTFLGNPASVSGGHTNMWRWQSLRDFSFNDVLAARSLYTNKTLVQGVEWNVPGHEHCSVGIITDEFGTNANANAIASFEYLWDANDADTSLGAKTTVNNHAKALAGVAWMQANFPSTSWMVPAHPERRGVQAYPPTYTGSGSQGYSVAAFRDLNNAGPSVCFGFESMPGHQKESGRGGYGTGAAGSGTYGGCGDYAAKVGGLWDALLGEGRGWWLFASSDFHYNGGDFWPGEYQKTYTAIFGPKTPQAVVDGLRSGDSFVVEGDLIDALDFNAAGISMGGTLFSTGTVVTVNIRVHDPQGTNNGPAGLNMPVLDHLDLIAGQYTAQYATNDPAYLSDSNVTTRVVARLAATNGLADSNGLVSQAWTDLGDGWKQMSVTFDTQGAKTYFRLRGSNLGLNVAGQTDGAGNPLVDPQNNTPAAAWADLWFYSNPVFVDFFRTAQTGPANGTVVTHSFPTLTWSPVAGATGYTVALTFPGVNVMNYNVAGTSFPLTFPLINGNYSWTVTPYNANGTGLPSAVSTFTMARTMASGPWKFGVMSDTQWTGVGADPVNNTNNVALSIINQLNPQFINAGVQFVVQVGDLTQDGYAKDVDTRAAGAQALYNAGIGFFTLRGNHESSQTAARQVTNDFPQTQGLGANVREAVNFTSASSALAGLSYSFDYNNARFMFLDQFTRLDGTGTDQNNAMVDQVPWIGTTLSNRLAGTHAFVFSHKQLMGEDHQDSLFGASPASNSVPQNQFISALKNTGVRYTLSGHDHMHQRSIITSPDTYSSVQEIICGSDSSKFYTPSATNDPGWAGQKYRETSVAQDLYRITYYIVTVDGPKVTVDYYASNETFPSGNSPNPTPTLHFSKRETFGYSLNGGEFLVPQGASYTSVQSCVTAGNGFLGTCASILGGTNGSTVKDASGRPLTKTVDTAWSLPSGGTFSDVLSLLSLTDIGATQTDSIVFSVSYAAVGVTDDQIDTGLFCLASKDSSGKWINAVDANVGGTKTFVKGPWNATYGLGTYGVDKATHTAWAVANHASDFAVVQLPPSLTISQSDGNVIVTWPLGVPGYGLQFNSDLSTTNWVPVNGNGFFRLVKP